MEEQVTALVLTDQQRIEICHVLEEEANQLALYVSNHGDLPNRVKIAISSEMRRLRKLAEGLHSKAAEEECP